MILVTTTILKLKTGKEISLTEDEFVEVSEFFSSYRNLDLSSEPTDDSEKRWYDPTTDYKKGIQWEEALEKFKEDFEERMEENEDLRDLVDRINHVGDPSYGTKEECVEEPEEESNQAHSLEELKEKTGIDRASAAHNNSNSKGKVDWGKLINGFQENAAIDYDDPPQLVIDEWNRQNPDDFILRVPGFFEDCSEEERHKAVEAMKVRLATNEYKASDRYALLKELSERLKMNYSIKNNFKHINITWEDK